MEYQPRARPSGSSRSCRSGSGRRPERQQALTGRLRYDGLDFHTVNHIAEDLECHYLHHWAEAIRGPNPPKLERTARSIAAHLLDLGFGPNYLHRWWTYKTSHEATTYSLADIVEEAHSLARRPIQAFQVLLAFQSSPRSKAGYPPDWLTPGQLNAWLAANSFDHAGPGIKGGLIRAIEARDPDTAAEVAGEFIDNLTARASVGTGDDIDAAQHVWVAGEKGPTQLKRRLRGVRVRALYREGQIIPTAKQHAILDPAIEMLSHLERSSPSAAVAGGWGAIEALLSEPNDRGAAAERLASLVACSFPRAELTVLSYLFQRNEPSLAMDLANCTENRDRSLLVARAIHARQHLTLPGLSDKAALSRMRKLFTAPRKTLEDLRTHITETPGADEGQRERSARFGSFHSSGLVGIGSLGIALWDVLDLNCAPLVLKVLGHKAAMAIHRFLLAAQEASTVEEITGNGLFDLARAHEV